MSPNNRFWEASGARGMQNNQRFTARLFRGLIKRNRRVEVVEELVRLRNLQRSHRVLFKKTVDSHGSFCRNYREIAVYELR